MRDGSPHILIVPYYFAPLGWPRSIRWTNIAYYLAAKGAKVTVIAANFPTDHPIIDPDLSSIVAAADDHLKVLRIPARPAAGNSIERSFWPRQAIRAIQQLEDTYDAVISSALPIVSHTVGKWVKRTRRASLWIADYGDPWSTSELRHNSRLRRRIEKRVEQRILASADALTITTIQALDAFTQVFPHRDRIYVIPQGASAFHLAYDWDADVRQPGGQVRLLYTGGITAHRFGLNTLFEALRRVGSENSMLSLVGTQVLEVRNHATAFGCAEQVRAKAEYVGLKQIVQHQSQADLLVNFAYKNPNHVAGKLYEYLATDKPILYITHNVKDEPSRLIRTYGAGYVCSSADEIVNAIKSVQSQIERTGRARRNRVLEVGFDERADRFLALIDRLLQRR